MGSLDAITALSPNASLLREMYSRKEAVLSSQIEGTRATFQDLLLHEDVTAPDVSIDDLEETSSCVAAMAMGLAQSRPERSADIDAFAVRHASRVAGNDPRQHKTTRGGQVLAKLDRWQSSRKRDLRAPSRRAGA